MGATVAATGREEQPRAPSRGQFEIPQAKFLLFASWVIILQGALIALFLPILVFSTTENIPPADIAMFGFVGVVSLVGGSSLYVARRWTWWVALGATALCGGYLVAVGGLTDQREGYLAVALSVAGVVLLVLGKAAAGRTEAIALASARVPFRLKVTAVWIAIFFIIGIFLVLSDLDMGFIRENLWYIAKGLEFTILLAALRDRARDVPGAARRPRAALAQRGRVRRLRLLHVVLPRHAADRPAVPDLPRAAADRVQPERATSLRRTSSRSTPSQPASSALGLNYGAYMTEIFRAGIQSVGHGQAEAADALGMTYRRRCAGSCCRRRSA